MAFCFSLLAAAEVVWWRRSKTLTEPLTVSEVQRDPIAAKRGRRSPFHACWYPVALSNELGPGEVRGIPFLGGRVVVYRTEGGVAQVRSAYCRSFPEARPAAGLFD
jgi:hypothetical protein